MTEYNRSTVKNKILDAEEYLTILDKRIANEKRMIEDGKNSNQSFAAINHHRELLIDFQNDKVKCQKILAKWKYILKQFPKAGATHEVPSSLLKQFE